MEVRGLQITQQVTAPGDVSPKQVLGRFNGFLKSVRTLDYLTRVGFA